MTYGQKKLSNMLNYQDVTLTESSEIGVNRQRVFTFDEMELDMAF